jgi:arylsulfatase A-like enzyme
MRGEKLDDKRPLHWRLGTKWATRVGDWKVIRETDTQDVELYNLVQDPTEKTNVADTQPEKLKELQAIHDAWNKTLVAPLWVRNPDKVKDESAKTKAKK